MLHAMKVKTDAIILNDHLQCIPLYRDGDIGVFGACVFENVMHGFIDDEEQCVHRARRRGDVLSVSMHVDLGQ